MDRVKVIRESSLLGALPRDWERQATRRLGLAAWAASAGGLSALFAMLFVQPNVGGIRDGISRPLILVPIGFVASVAMALIARSNRLSPRVRLDVGLLYLVTLSTLMAAFRHSLPYDVTDVVRGPSAIAVAVLAFAVIVPVRPTRMAVAAVACALVDPLTLYASHIIWGFPLPRPTFWLWLFLPGTAACAVAVVVSRLLYQLGQAVKKAQDLGSYRLVERLGAGAMGEVWRAEHHTLARPAAIKLIQPSVLGGHDPNRDNVVRRRFEREARATAALESQHTIELYDFGTTEDGTLYYVMELLDGADLESVVEEHGPLEQGRVVDLLLQICDSLSDAHARGMVHRDIKPANIYLCRKGRRVDCIKVLDFGLVTEVDGEADSKLTTDNQIMGTPAYLAPEVAKGVAVDARTDIYALGCVAFWLLTGETVFSAANPLQMVVKHVQNKPPKVSDMSVEDIEPALEQLIDICLAKEADARPRSCEAISEALRSLGNTGWSAQDAHKWWDAHMA